MKDYTLWISEMEMESFISLMVIILKERGRMEGEKEKGPYIAKMVPPLCKCGMSLNEQITRP
jgi:hypothetical protein